MNSNWVLEIKTQFLNGSSWVPSFKNVCLNIVSILMVIITLVLIISDKMVQYIEEKQLFD